VHHPAERAVADLLTDGIDGRRPPECEADSSYLIGLFGGLNHCLGVCDGRRQRLLTEHVLLPADWRVPESSTARFTARVPIPHFNANIAVLARRLDEWASMTDEQLDQQRLARASCRGNGIRKCCGLNMRRYSGHMRVAGT
jgi:hypothetical protein